MKCNVVVLLVLQVTLSLVAFPTISDAPLLPTHSRKHHAAPLNLVKEDFVFDHVPRNLIVNVVRSVPKTDVAYKLVLAQEIVTMDSIVLVAFVQPDV